MEYKIVNLALYGHSQSAERSLILEDTFPPDLLSSRPDALTSPTVTTD